MSAKIDCSHIAERKVDIALRSPSTVLVEIRHLEFVHPHLTTLLLAGVVAHTNHHNAHIAERGVAKHRHAVSSMVGVVTSIQRCVSQLLRLVVLRAVAFLLYIRKQTKFHIHKVSFRPYGILVIGIVGVVFSGSRQMQRHLIFIEVAFHVGTKTHEHREIAVLQLFCHVIHKTLGVGEELDAFVKAQVHRCVLIYGTRVAGLQPCELHRH